MRRRTDRLSKAEQTAIARELRYINPANVAKDFPSARERKAIAAVFEWLSLNSTVAWRLKSGTFTNVACSGSGRVNRMDRASDALIMDEKVYERARKILAPERTDA